MKRGNRNGDNNMKVEILYDNGHTVVERRYVPAGYGFHKIIYRVAYNDCGSGGDVINVKEYDELPLQLIRDLKINDIINGTD